MLPSLLARDIQAGLKQFLVTAFEPSDSFFHGVMKRFVENEPGWMKGPFLQIGLPFRLGSEGRKLFGSFTLPFSGFVHQERAWARLRSDTVPSNILVATGTGSGKTECFLYPILDHCVRTKAAGERGIKALVIYPMNALATDQARRFAQAIAGIPAFKGLRVGLYVGGLGRKSPTEMVMTPTSVITDRETLRKAPPDVLLTNYKMLDYLLIRPKDRALWSRNGSETLRYVVVDELHTFDGAQGTDLALLLRRLRARLQTPAEHLVCVGTSATLGVGTDSTALREYARQVFSAPFPPDAVITEDRKSVAEFLGESPIEHVLQPRTDFADVLDPDQYGKQQEAVAAWFAVFFPEKTRPADVDDPIWRTELGDLLKKHLLFANLLKLLKGATADFNDLIQHLRGPLPESARGHIREVLDALLVLVAWARDPGNPSLPLVNIRVQLWMRELRRMVARAEAKPEAVDLRAAADLRATPDGVYFPLIQCSECHTTGWLSRLPPGSQKLSNRLDEIYNTWFAGRPEAVRLYPTREIKQPQVDGIEQRLCTACANLQTSGAQCQACGNQALVPVFRTTGTRTSTRGPVAHTWHDSTCPACGARDRQILLGARNATLGSQIVERSWASPFNDDKKLIAFSDSVQDAAHRGGFFNARTYANTVRTALAKAIDYLAQPQVQWSAFLDRLAVLWKETGSPLEMPVERFVAEFIGPNMTWQRDWARGLCQNGALPAGSRLPERVQKRLAWQAIAEFTYLSQRGRNLDRVGKATLAVPWDDVQNAAKDLQSRLREGVGLRDVESSVLPQWLWGFLTHLRRRGAVWHREMAQYVEDGQVWSLAQLGGRDSWMPNLGPYIPRPVPLTLGSHRDFDKLAGRRKTWFQLWFECTLGAQGLVAPGIAEAAYLEAIQVLEALGVLLRKPGRYGDAILLNPDQLQLYAKPQFLVSAQGKRHLTVPAEAAAALRGMPCLDAAHERYTEVAPGGGWHAERFSRGDLRRVVAAEHTGLLERDEREALESRFKAKDAKPWYENLLSATPTLELGVDIGDLSSVMLCSVPPTQASFLQRVGRAGRRDGNALATTLADGSSPHDLYFFEETGEMLAGEIVPPGVFLRAAEVLRRQLFAFCLDDWVGSGIAVTALPDKASSALDAIEKADSARFPYTFLDHVLRNEPRLLQGFLKLLEGDIDERVRERLTEYMQGAGDTDGLRTRLIKLLEELAKERKQHRIHAEQLKTRIQALKARPQDEATREDIERLDRERQTALELAKEINQRELLNTLTDAGLIPNYAFPEAGVELKSVLWRRATPEDATAQKYIALPAIRYERPAASALSEFAPENRFYANQRRVEVDQINMGLAKLEWWRLCPSCHHMQNLELHADAHLACPRCGDAMWGNLSQRRQLLRFKQAIANSDDTRVRIDDSAEDREPRFYVRQLLADFELADICEAWKLKAQDLPFGFEFVARATFRDVNFGELTKQGDSFKVADKESVRPGFKLCRHCGKVQTPPKRSSDGAEPAQQHAIDCEKRDSADQENIVDCLYLYREFSSEAMRILVPYTRSGIDEEAVQSFMAALQLGLKRRFGGKVDHLRMVTQDEPGRDGGPRRHFVMLYDSVPGGTGYLHQLLAQDARTLADVLRLAYEALTTCSCNSNPEKDGCYRCVYQYRLGRPMELVSRDRAKELLGELLDGLGEMVRVLTISDIFINPNFDSALEARFIESLRRLGGVAGLPPVNLVQEIVGGKSGFLLEIGSERYWIEPQVDVGPTESVAVACRPDFVISPAQSRSARKPIAVFCDGWAYHRSTVQADAQKRSAVVASGRFWVWSVTNNDVKAALDGDPTTDLESPLTSLNRHAGEAAPETVPRAEPQAFTRNAVAQLLAWLSKPAGDSDQVFEQLQRNAAWATFLMVPAPGAPAFKILEAEVMKLWQSLPHWMQQFPKPAAPAGSRDDAYPWTRMWWPAAFASGQLDQSLVPGLVLYEDEGDAEDLVLNTRWRRWLALFNTLQVVPGMVLATRKGLKSTDYEVCAPALTVAAMSSDANAALAAAWLVAINQAVPSVQAGMRTLADLGMQPPDHLGLELADSAGEVIAEAELAWSDRQVALLRPEQADYEPIWKEKAWQAVIAQGDWPAVVAALLTRMQKGNER
jgi:DEAD/DEAH box helicase domain-containing protein